MLPPIAPRGAEVDKPDRVQKTKNAPVPAVGAIMAGVGGVGKGEASCDSFPRTCMALARCCQEAAICNRRERSAPFSASVRRTGRSELILIRPKR
jgi:hypothetical protein